MVLISKFNPLDFPICLERPLWREPASSWLEHVPFGMFLVDLLRPGLLVELGTCDGVSYGAFCQAVKHLDSGTHCFGIQAAAQAGSGACSPRRLDRFRSFHDPLYAGFSRLLPDGEEASLATFPDGSIDLLHIQAPGSYASAKHLFETWLPKLGSRALVLLHGIDQPGEDSGVRLCWDELIQTHPGFEFHHGGGLGILAAGTTVPEPLRGLLEASPAEQQRIRDLFLRLGEGIELGVTLDEARRELADLQGQKETLTGLQAQLAAIQSGLTYRLIHRLRSLFDVLLPLGTRRREAAARLAGDVRSLSKRGPALLADKTDDAAEHGPYQIAYSSLLNTSLGQRNPEYVGLSDKHLTSADRLVKLIAFYLPQFHPIPENDVWWGRGFTEWTNVAKAVPQFEGHYQPRLPGELGFYDLRLPEVQRRQVELARQYGLAGFCFHYYWFEGRRLLERPLDQFLSDPQIDFPFCICWANENWTRRWDGREDEILIGQQHSVQSDISFIRDIEPILRHKNYIRIDGRPVIVVYRLGILPDPRGMAERWRETAEKLGLGNPYLVAAQTFGFTDPVEAGFDAAVEFPPHKMRQRDVRVGLNIINPDYAGTVFDYGSAARAFLAQPVPGNYRLYRTVFPGWDNEPRRPGRGLTFAFSSPSAYREWLEAACRDALRREDPEERIVFINAWNEWGEGAYLEPDRRYGYAYLQATADALHALKIAS